MDAWARPGLSHTYPCSWPERFPGLQTLCLNNYPKVAGLIRRGIQIKPELMISQCGRNHIPFFGHSGPGTGLVTAAVFQLALYTLSVGNMSLDGMF